MHKLFQKGEEGKVLKFILGDLHNPDIKTWQDI